MTVVGAVTVAGLIVHDHWLRFGLLELGALLTVALVWQSARTRAAKLTYLAVVVTSAVLFVSSELLWESGRAWNIGQEQWARALFLTSVCVKLAAVPLFFWLLSLADEVPALVLGLIIAVVDMAAFGEFLASAFTVPSYVLPTGFLVGASATTSLVAALLMLTQRNLKRLLVLSTIEDIGFLMLGVVSIFFNLIGYHGAIIAAVTHALAKALLFVCLSAPEADGALSGEATGLAARYPVSAFGFLFGMLAMLGIPPTMGFTGRWRLYETALQINPLLLTVFVLSSIFALIAYVLALTRVWWGPATGGDPPLSSPTEPSAHPIGEPMALRAVIVALTGLLLVAGLWPSLLGMLMGGRP
jgi:formate hydrogenlyase subunit 3/multisubunit Na+/H+ antiporter MnhD subunit